MIINPNTSEDMTRSIYDSARKYARPDTEIVAVNPVNGPVSIENYYDEAFALPGILAEVRKGERDNFDAFILACYNDPALYASREIASAPVVGIAESSMYFASVVAARFSIIGLFPRDRLILDELLHRYGMAGKCASIRTTDLSVLDFERDPARGMRELAVASRKAVEEDGAEAVCLGCAGMARFAEDLEKELGVPVFDGVATAVKMAESLVDLGKKTSKVLYFKYPEKKEYKGHYAGMQP